MAASPMTLVSLSTYEAVHEVLRPLGDTLAGRTLVNLTSGSPVCATETAAWAECSGAAYLDGAVLTTPSGIGNRDFLQLYSGSSAAFESHHETLAVLGSPVYVGADAALSSVYDTALLCQMWATLTGWLHSVALISADRPGGNVTATQYTEVANRWMDTLRFFMTTYAPQIESGQYPNGGLPLTLHHMTTAILAHASELRGVGSGLPELFKALVEQGITAGHGNDSYARLIEFMQQDGDNVKRS
ncbi:NAD(P)-binding domain-containing protein [Streptomyces olivoverticillatus]